MINYKWLRIINYLYIVVLIAVIGLSLTIQPRASELRRGQLKPGKIIYCPVCGERLEIVEPDDPRLKK